MMHIEQSTGLGRYRTGYEKKMRMFFFCCLLSLAILIPFLLNCNFLYEKFRLSSGVHLTFMEGCGILLLLIELLSRTIGIFTLMKTKWLLTKSDNIKNGVIETYKTKEHRGGRGGVLWNEMIPLIKIGDEIVTGNSFQEPAPPPGTACSIIVLKNSNWIFKIDA